MQKPEPSVSDDIFTHMYKRSPCAINEHDQAKQQRINTQEQAGGIPNEVCVGRFQNKMRVRYRKVHRFRRMVRRVKAPKKSYFVCEIMIDEVRELPDNIAVN